MATNSFLGFSEDGTELFEMKSKLARQVGNDVSASVKSAIRTNLGVPASAEGLTPSNNLSDVASAETSRTNLDVMATADVNDRTNARQPANAVVFDSATAKLDINHNAILSFGDSSNDSPLSFAFIARADDWTSVALLNKRVGSGDEYDCYVDGSDKVVLRLRDHSAGVWATITQDTASLVDGEYAHIAVTYDGSGGSSAMDGATIYINGAAVAATAVSTGYTAMELNASAGVDVGYDNSSGRVMDGMINSVLVFNRELTAAQVATLATHGNTPEIADQWGGSEITSGSLVVGQRYRISNYVATDDFTNVGAGSNATDVEFIATGTTPTDWTNSSGITPIGAVCALLSESIESDGSIRDSSSNGLHAAGTNTDPLRKTQIVDIDAESPAADSMLLDVKVAGSSKAGIDAEGTIRQENLATDAPVAKYAADAITTAGTVSHQIPIDIGGTTYYLVAHTHGS